MNKNRKTLKMPVRYLMNAVLVVLLFLALSYMTGNMLSTYQNKVLMTVGIKPTRPDTGYGYIQVSDDKPISKVKCFTEKPDIELARVFLQSGEFFWNSGIFVWKVRSIVEAFEKYLPEHHALFSGVMRAIGTDAERNVVEIAFSECRAISIDYGIMEKADNEHTVMRLCTSWATTDEQVDQLIALL